MVIERTIAMIINLTIKNWMSFRNETNFSLVATEERRLKDRLPQIRKSPVLYVSPVAVVYGGNASGKSNLFRLFAFLKAMVCKPLASEEKQIPLEPFALSDKTSEQTTGISISFLAADDKIYTLKLSLSASAVLEESLSIVKLNGETLLYSRKNNNVKLLSSTLVKDKDAQAYARIIAKNQLFIGIAGTRIPSLKDPYQWFRKQLILISTGTSFHGVFDMLKNEPTDIDALAHFLNQLDTGIYKLGMEESSFDVFPRSIKEFDVWKKMDNGKCTELNFDGRRYLISKQNDQLTVEKLVSYHKKADGSFEKFNMSQESDGSLRLLDILPAFIDLEREDSNKVYIIDELDRSWHYALSRRLLGTYLSQCSRSTRAQLLFSTHDLMLMDQSLFRRDEMWIAERNEFGESSLFSLANCGIRFDKDIRKLYLQGALGGIPNLAHFGTLHQKENS